MRRVGAILIIVGAVLAMLAGLILFAFFPRQAQPVLEPTTSVIIAFQNIPERTEITADELGKMDWPQHIPTPIGAYSDSEAVTGKLSLVPIYAGQPIIDKAIVDKSQSKETKSNASLVLDPAMVAIALPVTVDSSVANAVQAGDRVDLLATFNLQPITGTQKVESAGPPVIVTQRLLQDVLIIQVGSWPATSNTQAVSGQTQSNVAMVTFQVSEQDALVVKYMQGQAQYFSLALRAANDHTLFNPTPVSVDYLKEHFGIVPATPGR